MNLRWTQRGRPARGEPMVPGALERMAGGVRAEPPESSARWPERILELTAAWRSGRDLEDRDRLLGDLWMLVNLALQRYARTAAGRLGGLDREDIRDIAADKALELLGRLDTRAWDPSRSTPAEICAFLTSVARHGVVDRLRARKRETLLFPDREGSGARAPADEGIGSAASLFPDTDSAEHARAIVECAGCLTPRARRAWVLRVFHDFPSADIARHPEVASTPAAVDAMLLRCRRLMKTCMLKKGLDPVSIPAGTFTLLWELIATGRAPERAPALEAPVR